MTYRFIYYPAEYERVIPAVLIDKRAAISAISGQTGSVIKAFTDAQTALAKDCIFYKIETDEGGLAGYFTLKVIRDGVVSLLQFELRPSFVQFETLISVQIANFISSGDWQFDNL